MRDPVSLYIRNDNSPIRQPRHHGQHDGRLFLGEVMQHHGGQNEIEPMGIERWREAVPLQGLNFRIANRSCMCRMSGVGVTVKRHDLAAKVSLARPQCQGLRDVARAAAYIQRSEFAISNFSDERT